MNASPVIDPRHLPEIRHRLAAWYSSPAATETLSAVEHLDAASARTGADFWSQVLGQAGMIYVDPGMCETAQEMATRLSTMAVDAEDDLPQPHGLLIWGRRPHVLADPEDGMRYAPDGVVWTTHGRIIEVTLLMDARVSDPTMPNRKLSATVARFTPPYLMPDLIPCGDVRIPADGRERPWSYLINGDGTEEATSDTVAVMRMLLATWLTIRQPASRRSLHNVERVSAPRASARRIERAGGDPTGIVDYVTLRRYEPAAGAATGARPSPGDGTGRSYSVRWWTPPHRILRHWPTRGESKRVWRGPFINIPQGCESAPIVGEERVYVLRR